ncbi:rhodanese-like domain-containing protein [Candidatus Woesearchaeota archaeon]|nr:rhodanese-like domain-containing protein [Candidatus Woesearchaeota archaeon]
MKNCKKCKNHKWMMYFAVLMFIALLALGCTSNVQKFGTAELQKGSYKNMTTDELNEQLKSKDFVLIDVHIPEQEHIKVTDAFIPYDKIENQLDKLPSDKNSKIVLYCRTGRMSEIAADKLAEMGYTNVYNVIGGKVEWDKKGYSQE